MLDKADVAHRLVEEMQRTSVTPARLAEKTGVTIQAIYGWTSTGRFARKHFDALRSLGFDLAYLLTGERASETVRREPPAANRRATGKQLSDEALWVARVFDQLSVQRKKSVAETVGLHANAQGLDVTLPEALRTPGGAVEHGTKVTAKPRRSHRAARRVSQSQS